MSGSPSKQPDGDVAPANSTSGPFGALAGVVLWAVGNVVIAGGPMTGITLAFWRSWLAVVIYAALLVFTGRRLRMTDFRAVWQGGLAYALDIATFFTADRKSVV